MARRGDVYCDSTNPEVVLLSAFLTPLDQGSNLYMSEGSMVICFF